MHDGALVALEKNLRYGEDSLGGVLTAGNGSSLHAWAEPETEGLTDRLFDMARGGETARLAGFVDAGAPPNLADERGDTLLMLAARNGHAGTVRALAARGADPERANDRGQRPLTGAVAQKEDEVVRALLEAGADPRAGSPSAVEMARRFGHAEFLAMFDQATPPGA
ncbi:ankyrin repeat domain-containing protein [Actinomadura sp. GC306]|nr:ankyrin repeat domain-containing protein [Actinomadura sp. GC306]